QRRRDAPEGRQPGTDRGAGPRHRRLDAGQPQVSRTTRTTTDAAPGRRPRFRPPPGRGPAMPHRRSSTRPRVPLLLAALLFAPPLALADNAPVAIGSLGRGEAVPGQVVVEGVVTADFRPGLGGFYLQDDGDGDPATPDALLVQAGADMAVPPGFGPGVHCRISGGLVEVRAGADRLRALAPSRIGPCREGVPVEAVRLAAPPDPRGAGAVPARRRPPARGGPGADGPGPRRGAGGGGAPGGAAGALGAAGPQPRAHPGAAARHRHPRAGALGRADRHLRRPP